MPNLVSCKLGLLLCLVVGTAYGETTVVRTSYDDFPQPRTTTFYVDNESLWLKCSDNHSKIVTRIVLSQDIPNLLGALSKLEEWMQLNKGVKAKVTKSIPIKITGIRIVFMG